MEMYNSNLQELYAHLAELKGHIRASCNVEIANTLCFKVDVIMILAIDVNSDILESEIGEDL